MKKFFAPFFAWVDRSLSYICHHPDHMQRLSIIGGGMSIYPLVCAVIWCLVMFGKMSASLALIVVPILGHIAIGLLILFAITLLTLMGLVKGFKGLKATLPGGATVEFETTENKAGQKTIDVDLSNASPDK